MMSKPTTRSETDLWLIGQMSDSLPSNKLPSKREVMSLFYYYKKMTKQTVHDAAHLTNNDTLDVWVKAHIPTRLKKHVVQKVEDLFKEYDKLIKNKENKAKRSETLRKKEEEWNQGLDNLFDIAHARAMEMMSIQEDREVLIAQRQTGRLGKMGSIDKVLEKRESNVQKRRENYKRRIDKEEEERRAREEKVIFQSSSDEEDKDTEDDEMGEAAELQSSAKRTKRGRLSIVDDKLSVSLTWPKLVTETQHCFLHKPFNTSAMILQPSM